MKFAFLVALLIALVAVSSAAWTIVAPVADAKWTEGTVVTLQFKTDAAVEVKDTFSFIAVDDDAADAFWAPNAFAVKGQGSFQYCTVGDKIVATVAGKTLSFIEEVAIDATVSCSVRVALGAATPVVVTAGEDSVDVEIVASAAKVEVVSASANDDRSTAVELKFSGLVANSIVGPVTFGYKFEKSAAAGVGITASPLFYNQFLASDYATVVFGEDVRMLWQGTQAWIVTGDKFADSTLALEYFDYELTAAVVTDDRGKDYSVWAVIDGATPATGDKTLLKVATVQTVEANTASITRAAGTITYGQQVKVTADKPMWSFSISDYDADTVFGAGATLVYIVGGAAKPLTFTDKKFEYELTDAKANDVVVVSGSFKVTDEWTKLTKFESSVGGKSASAQLATACTVTKVEIGSLTEGVIDYTLTVGGDKDFKGEVSCDRSYASALNQLVGDIRAAGEYTPSCEGTGASVSVDDKVTKDDADVNRRRLSISATLADGSKTATVKCTQKIGDAASKRSSKTVALNVDTVTATKDLLTAAATVKDRRQKITVKSRAITDSATFTAVLGEVVTALKAYDEENFKDLAVGDFHYTTDLQTYSAGTLGFDFLFKTFANEYSNQGSQLTLVFTATNQPDAAVTGTTLYGAGFEYSFTSLVDGTYEGFEAPAVYLDGSVDATYLANQFVQHGLGVKCATTQQCTGGYCNKAVCTPLTQLTFAQQAAITGADGSTSASSALFTGLALLLAVIAIFA